MTRTSGEAPANGSAGQCRTRQPKCTANTGFTIPARQPGVALAVFHGRGSGPWARLFGRDGFRHCFVAVAAGDYWITFDALAGTPMLEVVAGTDADLADHYRRLGFAVLRTHIRRSNSLWPFMAATCVGAAKKVLGINPPWVLTPWQLYRHLRDRERS